jgi:hypothetical protein
MHNKLQNFFLQQFNWIVLFRILHLPYDGQHDIQDYHFYFRFLADRFVEGTCPLCGFHVRFQDVFAWVTMFTPFTQFIFSHNLHALIVTRVWII